MSDGSDNPITVTNSAVPSNVMTALRDLLKMAGMALVTHGVIKDPTMVEPLVGAVLTLGVAAWSQYVTTRNHTKLKTVAAAAPNEVAQIK